MCHSVISYLAASSVLQRGRLLPALYDLSLILRSFLYVEVTDYTSSYDDMRGASKEAVMAESRRYLEICLDGLRKTLKFQPGHCVPA
jgi:hypothetical protein